MALGVCAEQMRVTFEDITVFFSQEEWEYLDEGQKELYGEVVKENYEILMSLENDPKPSNTEKHNWKLLEKPEGEKMLPEREKEKTRSCSDWEEKGKNLNKQKPSPGGSVLCTQSTSNIIQAGEEERNRMRDQSCSCDICEIFLGDQLKSHHRSDTEERPSTCTDSGKNVSQKRKLQGQEKTCIKEKHFTGSACGKGFSRKKELMQHEKTNKETRMCTGYEKNFISKTDITKDTSKNTISSCPECDQSFSWEENFTRNATFLPGDKSVLSTECQKSFSYRDVFTDRKKSQTGRQTSLMTRKTRDYILVLTVE
ncbi:zinc finger protein 184-like [Microcaecilia unicolor]|uniref:Zinc finger protein 184-like n=1 Tax=Microcaecilia unicolor TaxID=1415580 RepID=A0A6P7X1L1_9AMPH|nr:zinc finger protein 184-like [Microcaecilia unicolor]